MSDAISLPARMMTTDELVEEVIGLNYTPTVPLTVFDIVGVPKEHLFLALYNAAKVVNRVGAQDLTLEEVRAQVHCCYVCGVLDCNLDYTAANGGYYGRGTADEYGVFRGRVMNIDLSGDEMDTSLYDAANGEGAAYHVTKTLLAAIEAGITPALSA